MTEWDGSGDPGFIFDEAKIQECTITKYAIYGQTQQFYYTANSKLKAVEKFNEEDWRRLDNFNFRMQTLITKQTHFDFYDLDTDNFDTDPSKNGTTLDYPTYEYLRNIINDDVVNTNFNQGYIREKGTSKCIKQIV